jgi:hypothetical protein
VGLDRGPLSLVSTTEELLERETSGYGLEIREYGRRDLFVLTTQQPLSTKVGTKFADKRRSVARSVQFARGLRPRSLFVCLLVHHRQIPSDSTEKVVT